MREMTKVLEDLGEPAAGRVIRWLADRFRVEVSSAEVRPDDADITGGRVPPADFAELFATTKPVTGQEKALVAGYWFQVIQGQSDLDSQTLNTELKNLGYGLKNVTKAFSDLQSQRPQLVLQVRKEGRTAQARKRYRLTAAGVSRVREMMSGERG
jgi:hypothetical protein